MTKYRLAFIMEQHLGHFTHAQNLRMAVAQHPEIDPTWIEVTYTKQGGFLERLPLLSPPIRGALRGIRQVKEGLAGKSFDGLFFFTYNPAVFQRSLFKQIPVLIGMDVTPRLYDEMGAYYNHKPAGHTPVGWYKHWATQQVFHRAKVLIAWTNWVKASLLKDYGVADDKIVVIPPGVDLELWHPQKDRPPAQLPLKLLFIGGDFKRKGGEELLRWYKSYGRERCTLHLVTKEALPPYPGVFVYNNFTANSPQLRQLCRECDLFVLPSKGECFGLAYIEALASGLPVIATTQGGTADIVQEGVNGLRIEPQEAALAGALNVFIDSPELCRSMGRAARIIAEKHFNLTTNANRRIQTFCSMVDREKALSTGRRELLTR